MQFQSQNRFLAKNGKSFESFLSSIEYDKLSVDDRETVISGYMQAGSVYECITNGCFSENTVVFFDEGFVQKSLMFNSCINDI